MKLRTASRWAVIAATMPMVAFLLVLLHSCAPPPAGYGGGNAPDVIFPGAVGGAMVPSVEAFAHGKYLNVYRFTDNDRTCYFTEANFGDGSGGGIWCTP